MIGDGGFGTIYKALWKEGPISGISANETKFKRTKGIQVVLKSLKRGDIQEYLKEETKGHKDTSEGSEHELVQIFPKLLILVNIANALRVIHEEGIINRDLHCGNILIGVKGMTYISDFGLSHSYEDFTTDKIYGIMPFVAPELLNKKEVSIKSDVYSFGIIMWVLSSGIQPFHNCDHNHELALKICGGIRPQMIKNSAPDCYNELMKRCWNSDPKNRPTSLEIYDTLCSWFNSKHYKKFKEIDNADKLRNIQKVESHTGSELSINIHQNSEANTESTMSSIENKNIQEVKSCSDSELSIKIHDLNTESIMFVIENNV
ncbi:kinase-like domain-containing protein [Gigaspora rosea]|uniref:Kinase-like domain-containing protein n=1 Tax=Gigaspora rosea TaxID=44941 RepID=A0A397UVA1_9GLOM|nr:kinase-like domain-containing protein [Gigaspora rosea]